MTTQADVVNLALQSFGSRTTVTAAELAAQSSNEAIQASLVYTPTLNSLLRMAPWDCGIKTANLTYITSVPGTPENESPVTNLWTPGQPAPPWAYEYQYPVDCLRACWLIPATQFGFAGGTPITTAVTGGASTLWNGAPIRFKVQTDQFFAVTSAAVANGGTGYAVGDTITLATPPNTTVPIGAPVQLTVTAAPGGVVSSVSVVNQVLGEGTPLGGSYFAIQPNPVAQGSTTGSGTGATFNLTQQTTQSDQRVILTMQEFATLAYVKNVSDPNVFDPLFQEAFQFALGARIVIALTGDKVLANNLIAQANAKIIEARKVDGNEGLTLNNVTPDWIRARGIWWTDNLQTGPYGAFDWGGILPSY